MKRLCIYSPEKHLVFQTNVQDDESGRFQAKALNSQIWELESAIAHRKQFKTDEQRAFSAGFTAGNYGSAYESEEYFIWRKQQPYPAELPREMAFQIAYDVGCMFGFFSSFEGWELPDAIQESEVLSDPYWRQVCSDAGIESRA